jgi:hypothetical protein
MHSLTEDDPKLEENWLFQIKMADLMISLPVVFAKISCGLVST